MTRTPTFSLRIGALVGQAISTHFRNLLPFTLLSAIALGPWIALRLYASTAEPSQALLWTGVVLQQLGSQILVGALTYGVVQHLRGEPANLAMTVSVGVQSFLRVIAVSIVVGLIIGVGTLLLFVPGIILMMCFYVAIPAAVLERKGIGASMRRSLDLTRGSRWQIFGAAILFGLIMIGTFMLLGLVMASTSDLSNPPLWAEITLNVLIAPFGSTMAGVCYYMLRMGKENVDSKQIAAVFD